MPSYEKIHPRGYYLADKDEELYGNVMQYFYAVGGPSDGKLMLRNSEEPFEICYDAMDGQRVTYRLKWIYIPYTRSWSKFWVSDDRCNALPDNGFVYAT